MNKIRSKLFFGKILTCLLISIICLLISFLSVKADTKREDEKMLALSKAVVLCKDSDLKKDNMLLKVVLLNTKPKVKRETSSEQTNYNEYRYSDFVKTSKKLFGKVIPLNVTNKRNKKTPTIYYDKETEIIYEPLCYDLCIWDDARFVKYRKIESLGKNKFIVHNYAIRYPDAQPDKIPTENIKVYLKTDRSSKNGYIVTDIQIEYLKPSAFKLGKKDVAKQIKDIKNWYYKSGSSDKKETYEVGKFHFSYLIHDNNLVFIVQNYGDSTMRFYYKYGVLIKYIETGNEDNKIKQEYNIYYKNNDVYMNDKKVESEDDMKFLNPIIDDSDNALGLVLEQMN